MKAVGIGTGGHARVVAEAAALGGVEIVGFTDADTRLHGTKVGGLLVLGGDDVLPDLLRQGVKHAFLGVGSVGDNRPRAEIFHRLRQVGLEMLTVVHPAAVVSKSAKLGRGAVVLAGAILNPGVSVGENAIINTGAIVDHDCQVGAHAHIAPGAVLSGGVVVGEGAHIGTGAAVKQGIRIGAYSIIGAGAVVVGDVAEMVIAKGVPARAFAKTESHV